MSNLTKRLLTGLIGAPTVFVLIYLGSWWFLGLVMLVVAGAQYEFYRVVAPEITKRHLFLGLLLGVGVVFWQYGMFNLEPVFVLALVLLVARDAFAVSVKDIWKNTATMLAGLFYPAYLFSFIINLRNGWDHVLTQRESFALLVCLLLLVWVTDSMAYFTGRSFGKTPLAPTISPKKTWEGTLGGFFSAVVVAVLLKIYVLHFLGWLDIFVCALIGGAIGQVGDLVESRLKRIYGVKDSGNILPGHGGILDRIDGLILVVPLYYLYLANFSSLSFYQ